MGIGKLEIFIVPGVVCAFVAGSKVTQFDLILLSKTVLSKI